MSLMFENFSSFSLISEFGFQGPCSFVSNYNNFHVDQFVDDLSMQYYDSDILFDIINCSHFSEIHLSFKTTKDIENFLQKKDKLKPINGFMYIYSPFLHKYNIFKDNFKKLKKMPRIQIITFSTNICDSLIKPIYQESPHFTYCKTGFKYKYLRISLSNVPIYDHNDDNETFKSESVV